MPRKLKFEHAMHKIAQALSVMDGITIEELYNKFMPSSIFYEGDGIWREDSSRYRYNLIDIIDNINYMASGLSPHMFIIVYNNIAKEVSKHNNDIDMKTITEENLDFNNP